MAESLHRVGPSPRQDRVFFGVVALWFLLLNFVGFAPSFFLRPLLRRDAAALPLSLVIHGVVYSAWVLLYVTQTALVSARRIRVHSALGAGSVALLLLMIPVGLHVVLARLAAGQSSFTAVGFNVVTLSMGFGCAFAGIAYRKRPFVHKRLMLFATLLLTVAAADRVAAIAGYGDVRAVRKILAVLPGLALVVYDAFSFRRAPILSGSLLAVSWLNLWLIASNAVFARPVGEKVLALLTRLFVW